ncbi:MAG: aminodeoxychorismate synthase component I [Candidatus Omnitrophica bacterium]|nr:aminodeoxychorismate synthase component I [Candidatus Omnitrophota bacterium]
MADTVIEKITGRYSPADLFDPVKGSPYAFFLDSALRGKNLGRFSFLGCDPFLVFKSKKDAVMLEWADGRTESFRSDPFSALEEIFAEYKCGRGEKDLPFSSGGVGYFSYDLKDFIEDLPDRAKNDLGLHDCVMGFYDTALIYDNIARSAYIASSGLPYAGKKRAARRSDRLKEFKEKIRENKIASARFPDKKARQLKSNFSKAGYIDAIRKAKHYIKKGDIYQVNISQRFEADLLCDPAHLYPKLRALSPAPFASYLGFGDTAILSSSPERFLLKRGDHIETRPIKGTRPRGADRKSDISFAKELKKSVKDNAEHIMIVDLERNDLGKICNYGTVRQAESSSIEKYSNVFHMVSTVSGKLKKGTSPIDCLRAAFPGGSITGAPKVRSMEIIEELEPVKRSVYTGAIGYISFDGNMDTSVVIRTLIAKHGKVYFSVGGGIVADSDPEAEYQETLDKAKGIMLTLGL